MKYGVVTQCSHLLVGATHTEIQPLRLRVQFFHVPSCAIVLELNPLDACSICFRGNLVVELPALLCVLFLKRLELLEEVPPQPLLVCHA